MDDIEEIKRAVAVCTELQAWLDEVATAAERTVAGYTWCSPYGVFELSIDDHIVWHSQVNSTDDMTFEFCRSAFVDHCSFYADIVRSVHPSPFSKPFTNQRSSMGLPKHS